MGIIENGIITTGKSAYRWDFAFADYELATKFMAQKRPFWKGEWISSVRLPNIFSRRISSQCWASSQGHFFHGPFRIPFWLKAVILSETIIIAYIPLDFVVLFLVDWHGIAAEVKKAGIRHNFILVTNDHAWHTIFSQPSKKQKTSRFWPFPAETSLWPSGRKRPAVKWRFWNYRALRVSGEEGTRTRTKSWTGQPASGGKGRPSCQVESTGNY